MKQLIAIATVVLGLALAALAGKTPASAAEPLVVVPNRVIYPGQQISAEAIDLVALRRNLPNPDAIAFTMEEVVGQVASRTLLPGRLIPRASMRAAWLIEPGAPVQVLFVHGGLTITATAVPLQPGAAGDLVKVRNIDSGVVFTGIVMADGTVRVGAS